MKIYIALISKIHQKTAVKMSQPFLAGVFITISQPVVFSKTEN